MTNKPSSFKEIKFPPSRDGKYAVYAPLPPVPARKVITEEELKRRSLQAKEMKEIANRERCPICGAQLDGLVGYNKANLYCAANGEDQFKVSFIHGMEHPVLSISTLYMQNFAYEIKYYHLEKDLYFNSIYRLDLSLSKKYQQLEKKEIVSYQGSPLIIKGNLTEQQLLNKIKLYTIFI